MSAWQPLLFREWTVPGTAKTSLSWSSAIEAVIIAPPSSSDSTTTVPRERPLMILFRLGKFPCSGPVPGGYSETTAPEDAISAASLRFSGG